MFLKLSINEVGDKTDRTEPAVQFIKSIYVKQDPILFGI
jgi:hypothetical protein